MGLPAGAFTGDIGAILLGWPDRFFETRPLGVNKSLGLTARTFASPESYLQSSWVKKTHCLITDVQMPNISGLELQERLSHLGFDIYIPIIFITAYPDEAVRTKAINAGAVCFLHKPLDLKGPRVADCLQAALGGPKGPSKVTSQQLTRSFIRARISLYSLCSDVVPLTGQERG
jgi:FixJ family two-component response regulator